MKTRTGWLAALMLVSATRNHPWTADHWREFFSRKNPYFMITGWWFQACFFSKYMGESLPLTNIFQRGRYTTNQITCKNPGGSSIFPTIHWAEASLQCPITREFIADPVLAGDGYTYERQSIQQHWANQLEGPKSMAFPGGHFGGNREDIMGFFTIYPLVN